MTVKQLKRKLEKIPDDVDVIITNYSAYIDGDYIATETEYREEEKVLIIDTDYKKRLEDEV